MTSNIQKEKFYNIAFIIIAILGSGISLFLKDITSIFIIIGLLLINFRLSITRYYALVGYVIFLVNSIGFNPNNILSIIIYGLIVYRMYTEWNSSGKTIRFIHLDAHSAQVFTSLMGIMIFVNTIIYLIETGFEISLLFSFPVMYSMFSSTLKFLAIYMISLRIYEASYFYLGYLVLTLIMLILISLNILNIMPIVLMITIIKILLTVLFILKNK